MTSGLENLSNLGSRIFEYLRVMEYDHQWYCVLEVGSTMGQYSSTLGFFQLRTLPLLARQRFSLTCLDTSRHLPYYGFLSSG